MDLIFTCPHCEDYIIVGEKDVNCGIFRHGANPDGSHISPHLSMEECERLRAVPNHQGCVKPFRIVSTNPGYRIEVCDYV
jgi:hypothetical protein